MKLTNILVLFVLLFSTSVFSMGNDKPGPHGGYVRMPGTYHVELVDQGSTLRVYLLDISIKNPVIENSSVVLNFAGSENKKFTCRAEAKERSFICQKPGPDLKAYSAINLESVRNGIKGSIANFTLPLKLEKSPHSMH